jgi:Ni,Fe-hydrogenase I cytochrome b subunit
MRFLDRKQEATDRLMRDTIRFCHFSEGFLLLHHTMQHHRPVFSGKSVVRVFRPWPPFANHRRRSGVSCFILSQQVLDLEIQFSRRGKEEGENW